LSSDKRFIEDTFPVKEVGVESSKEKSIRHGHPSTLHIWWARRPLASSRATIYASLIPAPRDSAEEKEKRQFIIEFSKWENTTNERMAQIARKEILQNNGGIAPKVLDPFAGGGSIPLEALRLGCETHSSDLNPVSVLLQKCTLEFPQRYSQQDEKEFADSGNKLTEDIEFWAEWVFKEARKELQKYYPPDTKTTSTLGYIFARVITCQNPNCGAEIPLMRQFWLSKKKDASISLFPEINGGDISFTIVGKGHDNIPKGFDPKNGTVSKAVVTCPICSSTIDSDTTRHLLSTEKEKHRMIALVLKDSQKFGKIYRVAQDNDKKVFEKARLKLSKKVAILKKQWGIDPIPSEPTPEGKGSGAERAFSIRNYGLDKWGDIFNSRQKLSLVIFAEKVRLAHEKMHEDGVEPEYAKAIVTYLALVLDRLVDKNATLVFYNVHRETIEHVFGRQTLSMVWDYIELNPFSGSGWTNMTDWVLRNLENFVQINNNPATILQTSATSLAYSNNYFDAVFTDPPYYDNIPYSYLSDLFYVWLKRAIGHLYPELFSTPLTPKKNEIVAYSYGDGGFEEGKKFFEDMLSKSFKEIHRVLKPYGIAVIVYAHRSTEGWETLINSLLNSGLVMTGAWPIHTEKAGRLRSHESAALASSIYIVARKMDRQSTGIYKDIKAKLEAHLEDKLDRLWKEDIGGADFFISAIGSAIEVFGKYENVIDYEGNSVRADKLLDDVQDIVLKYALNRILENGSSVEISSLSRFYLLFRWHYQAARVEFDEARKLAQSCGMDITKHWGGRSFIRKNKEFIEVLGPQDRKLVDLKDSSEMIDVLHQVLLLWDKGQKDMILGKLTESGYNELEDFWRFAQAVSHTLPMQNKERKLLDGFLAGRSKYSFDGLVTRGTK